MTKLLLNDKLIRHIDGWSLPIFGVNMKKFIKIIILSVLLIISTCMLFACGSDEDVSEKGLRYSLKFDDNDVKYYTVVGYVDDGTEKLVIPKEHNGVKITTIKSNVFSGNDTIKELVIPTSIETIQEGALSNMKKLEKVTLPFIGKTAISDAYFGETGKIANKSVDKERTFGFLFGTESYEFGVEVTQNFNSSSADTFTYYMPMTLKEVSVDPLNNYGIPFYAFSGNEYLEKVNLSEKVNKIGDYAFNSCEFINNIEIPSAVTYIGKYAFANTSSLKNITFNDGDGDLIIKDFAFTNSGIESITLPNNIKVIGERAFKDAKSLKTVSFNSEINDVEILDYAFFGDSALVKFNSAYENVLDFTGIKTVGVWAFANLGENEFGVIQGNADINETAFYGTVICDD